MKTSKGIVMSQRKYTLDLIKEMALSGSKLAGVPLDQNVRLTDELSEESELMEDPTRFQKLVGKLMYLTMTRPDLSYSVQGLSQFRSKPSKQHMNAATRVVKYLKSSPGKGLFMPFSNKFK